jgi:transcriptional regulator with XRE-family HTH domain
MTQSELAKQLGIDRAYLNGILRGKRFPGVKLAEKISQITGKNFFDLRPDLKKLMKEHL